MGQRSMRFSDLSGKFTETEEDIIRIVVIEHPKLSDGVPRQLDALKGELDGIEEKALKNVVRFELHRPGEDTPISLVMEAHEFDALATDAPMAEALKHAVPLVERRGTTGGSSTKVDYSDPAFAGNPKRGKVSDAEKQTVRANLAAINERLKQEGHRLIDVNDPAIRDRYGLADLEQ